MANGALVQSEKEIDDFSGSSSLCISGWLYWPVCLNVSTESFAYGILWPWAPAYSVPGAHQKCQWGNFPSSPPQWLMRVGGQIPHLPSPLVGKILRYVPACLLEFPSKIELHSPTAVTSSLTLLLLAAFSSHLTSLSPTGASWITSQIKDRYLKSHPQGWLLGEPSIKQNLYSQNDKKPEGILVFQVWLKVSMLPEGNQLPPQWGTLVDLVFFLWLPR